MHIAILTPSWPQFANPNGIATYYSNLVPALRSLGHRVFVITLNNSEPEESDVFTVEHTSSLIEKLWCRFMNIFSKGYSQYYIGSRGVYSTLNLIHKKYNVDVCQMEDSFGWHFHVQNRCSFPVVVRLHGPHFLNNFEEDVSALSRARLNREKRAFLNAKFVTSPSENVLDLTREKYGENWKFSKVVVNSMSPVEEAEKWDISSAIKNQILFVGRFDNHKGADILLEAVFKASKVIPDIRLIFIGPDRGLVKNGEKTYLNEHISKNNFQEIANKTLVYLGKKDKQIIAEYRVKSHISIVSSRYETFGNVALEAISSGCPVICSDAGALPEIIQHEDSGVLFQNEDSDDLCEKIITLLQDDEICKSISRNGYDRVKVFYSPVEAAKKLADFFEMAIKH